MKGKFKVDSRNISTVFTLILVTALILSGTLAWRDVVQHKTNAAKMTSVDNNVVLVENFKELEDWRSGETFDKYVSVRNGQDDDDVVKYDFDDAYVRVQFKEHMSLGDLEYEYSEHRHMIDADGNFIRDENKGDLIQKMTSKGIPGYDSIDPETDGRIERLQGYFDAQPYWYIVTQGGDDNGQYGKFVVMDAKFGSKQSLESNIVDASEDADDKHHEKINGEDNYSNHLWDKTGTSYAKESVYTEYARWNLGNDVIPIELWNGGPIDKWILDTSSDEGWAYWGNVLPHGTDLQSNPKSMTSKILESVTSLKGSDGLGMYYIHVNLDAVSKGDLPLWDDAPDDIIKALQGDDEWSKSHHALKKSIEIAEQYDLGVIKTPIAEGLRTALVEAKLIYNNPNSTKEELDLAKTKLDEALEAFIKDPVSAAKVKLNGLIIEATAKDRTEKHAQTVEKLDEALTHARDMMNSTGAEVEDLVKASEALEFALSRVINRRLENFADHDWTVLHITEDNKVLIMVDQLTASDYETMGIKTDGVHGVSKNVTIVYDDQSSQYRGYKESKVKRADEAFYNKIIGEYPEALYAVQPISFEEDQGTQKWNEKDKNPTLVDPNGRYIAFSLSVSDLNYYKIRREDLKNDKRQGSWLRSNGGGPSRNDAAYFGENGSISSIQWSTSTNHNNVGLRPALWVDLNKVDLGQ